MLDYDFTERLGDFGMVRFENYGDSCLPATAAIRTMGYMAPELTNNGKFFTRRDVYAFGAFILEVKSVCILVRALNVNL